MISCVTVENLRDFGALYPAIFRLRYDAFIERQDYDVRVFRGMEYDQYDTPATAYLVYHRQGRVLGVNRLTPTTQGCMLADLWPDLVEDKSLLHDDNVWEGTRYCIDKKISGKLRTRIVHEMAAAYLEFGLARKLRRIIGMMPTFIYRSVFERPGIEMEYLGPIKTIGRHKIRAVAIPVDLKQLDNVRQKTGLAKPVLRSSLSNESGAHAFRKAA